MKASRSPFGKLPRRKPRPLKGKIVHAAIQPRTRMRTAVWEELVARTVGLPAIKQHGLVNMGIRTTILFRLLESFEFLDVSEVLSAVGINSRKDLRRREGVLSKKHSSATLHLIEITQKAMDVFGSRLEAENWLHQPAIALNGGKPIELLSTSQGANLVKNHLTRMEYGVYA